MECNFVTPWLQGALAAIDSLAGDKPLVLGRMFMDRLPEVAFLWFGATFLGLQKKLLQDARFGLIPMDLHAAARSGTVQSFIQQPVSDPIVEDCRVSRADQCRLLFLSEPGSHKRVPICPWRPFGATALEDTEIEIRVHANCKGHALRYQGLFWDCIGDEEAIQRASTLDTVWPLNGPRRPPLKNGNQTQLPVLASG
jgi:hypothetical protein